MAKNVDKETGELLEKIPNEVRFAFDPKRDLSPVDQFGFVDLREAFRNNCLPGELTSSAEDYNGVEDPSSLLGKSSDVFESLRKAKYVHSTNAAAAEAAAASSSENE